MKNSRLYSVLRWLLVNACRMILSAAMILSGAVKMIDPRGTEYKIKDYAVAFGVDEVLGLYLPLLFSIALALTEFCLGVNLLFGNNRRWTSRVVLALFLLFTPFTLYLAIENPVSDCGCFGDAWILTNWQTFGKNVVLLTCAILVCRYYKMQTRLISEHAQWLISLYNWMYAFVLTLYCIYTLPVMDFRPYHIGADIHAKMQWDDTDKIPPITDLVISDPLSGEDMTDSIISGKGWKFLVVAPRLESADDGVMDKLAELTEYCSDFGYQLVALTASSDSLIEYWRDITGAEYKFLVADEIPLKTMIRSNPGVILLNGSVVANKWASSQIPGQTELVAPLDEMPWAQKPESTYAQRFFILLSWYIIPLLAFTILDKVWMGIRMLRERKNRT
ncbi:MAG: DoxX family protein [Bacteroidaceae bacterium]|nr:DoxX family protein [Bacteroidaceae bacterium]